MATRRPNVPRVSPAARAPEAGKTAQQGADIIRAHFGTGVRGAGEKPAGLQEAPATVGKDGAGPGGRTAKTPDQHPSADHTVQDSGNDGGPQAGAPAPEDLDPVPAKAFSGRLLALAVVMIAITVMLAPTVKIYIDKSAEISALNADIAAKRAEQAALNQQISRWQDPNYVKQQARDRINMVMPGETSYWVFGSDEPADTPAAVPNGESAVIAVDVPWVDALWESVRRSGTE